MTGNKDFKILPLLFIAGFYLLLDLFIGLLFLFGRFSLFRTISFIYYSNFVVLPISGLIFFFINLLRKKNSPLNLAILSISLVLLSIFIYATYVEPRSLRIIEIEINTDKFDTELTIAHISDIQSKRIGAYEKKVFEKIAEIQPDIVFHTGDLIQAFPEDEYEYQLASLARLFKKLNPKYGVFNVIGNIDHESKIKTFDRKSGVKTLINSSTEVIGEGFQLDVLGLSWLQSMEGDKDRIDKWLQNNGGDFKILLGHAPDFILSIEDSQIDLCLAGHTHGGQVNLPLIGPLLNASKTPKSWAKGFRKVYRTSLNVSSGVGTERAPGLPSIRFNCPPSITIFKIIGQIRKDTSNLAQ